VTGVQTCALPICAVPESQLSASAMETALGVVHKICG